MRLRAADWQRGLPPRRLRRRLAGSPRYTRAAMTHVFVAPHPDDVALSCGGLIASLRELGQNVAIVTVFSGSGRGNGADGGDGLTTYQREALGFGSKAMWPVSEAFNRAHIGNDEPVYADDPDTLPAWAATTDRLAATPGDAQPRAE